MTGPRRALCRRVTGQAAAHNDDEVATCPDLGAAAYVQKPMHFADFERAVLGIIDLAA